jgi:hypothetical protein
MLNRTSFTSKQRAIIFAPIFINALTVLQRHTQT